MQWNYEYLMNDFNDYDRECIPEWNDKLEVMARICSIYDYLWYIYKDGTVVIHSAERMDNFDGDCSVIGKNEHGHREYKSLDDMLFDFLPAMQVTNERNGKFAEEIEFVENM